MYICKNDKDKFVVVKVIDVNKDKVYFCRYTDTDIINRLTFEFCLNYATEKENLLMNEDEKNNALSALRRFRERLSDAPTSRYDSASFSEFLSLNLTYFKTDAVTEEDKNRPRNIGLNSKSN